MSLSQQTNTAGLRWPDVAAALGRYISLLKLRPMSVVIYSAVIGLIAAQSSIDLVTATIAIVCIACGGGGSAALNMWYEADLDARMARTAKRALPSGTVKATKALIFGSVLCTGSIAIMGFAVNWPAAGVLAATIFAYFGIYTVALKRRTSLNVLIGGSLAGILTPLSGWTAATGELNSTGLVLFIYILFWTPPHVWSQAVYRLADYQSAGVPMLPVTAGLATTQFWILIFTIIHAAIALLPWFTGDAGLFYVSAAILAGLVLIWRTCLFAKCKQRQDIMREARLYFRVSIYYVVILLTALALDRTILST